MDGQPPAPPGPEQGANMPPMDPAAYQEYYQRYFQYYQQYMAAVSFFFFFFFFFFFNLFSKLQAQQQQQMGAAGAPVYQTPVGMTPSQPNPMAGPGQVNPAASYVEAAPYVHQPVANAVPEISTPVSYPQSKICLSQHVSKGSNFFFFFFFFFAR